MQSRLMTTIHEYQPFFDDIFSRLRRVALVFLIAFILSFIWAGTLVQELINFFDLDDVTIIVTSPFQLFNLSVNVSFMLASIVSVPYLMWNVYCFLRSGLTKGESSSLFKIVPISLALFVMGAVFGATSMYWGLSFMARQAASFGIENFWDVGTFISQLITTSAFLGIIFQFPIVLALLIKNGLVKASYFENKRSTVYALTFLSVALLPPSDGISLILMTAPLLVLYELTLFLYRRR